MELEGLASLDVVIAAVQRFVAAHAGVTNTVEAGLMVAGYPAIDSREWRRSSAVFRRLPEIKRRLEALEAAVRALTAPAGADKVEDPE